MTRERAIQILEQRACCRECVVDNCTCAECDETFDVAIKSLEQEPKIGHWEQYGDYWKDKFKCSECGKEQPKILCGERIIGHWSDYCPNCGCRMFDPQESEEKE